MEVYPRSKNTWPIFAVTCLVMCALLAIPRLNWRVPRIELHRCLGVAMIGKSLRPATRHRTSAHTRPVWSLPPRFSLAPPVGQRVAVDPAPDFSGGSEANTAQFPIVLRAPSVPERRPTPPTRVEEPPHEAATTTHSVSTSHSDLGELSLDLAAPDVELIESELAQPETTQPETTQAEATELSETRVWPQAVTLLSHIDRLHANSAQVASWVRELRGHLSKLSELHTLDHADAEATLIELEQIAHDGRRLEVYLEPSQRVWLRRIQYGVQRRVQIWERARLLTLEQSPGKSQRDPSEALPAIQQVQQQIAQHPQARSWHNYLRIDELRRLANEGWGVDATVHRDFARNLLDRLRASRLSAEQRTVVMNRAFTALRAHLEQWATQRVDVAKLLLTLEQFELLRSPTAAEQLVQQLHDLRFSDDQPAGDLALAINTHYRNANVRIALNERFINDVVPVLRPIQQQIRDNILGADVRGRQRTWTQLNVEFVEAQSQIHLRLRARGHTRARTVSQRGPVRLTSRDHTQFTANKDLVIANDGIRLGDSKVRAKNGDSQLLDVQSDYDQIPLLGWVIRQLARDEHSNLRGQVRSEVRSRVRRQARNQIDRSVQQRVSGAEQKLDDSLIAPLRRLSLDPAAVEMRTVDDQMVMRFRIAAQHQLAAYTPRPRPHADSSLDLQIHESAANNLVDQLDLEDRNVQLEELIAELQRKLKLERSDFETEIPEGIEIQLGSEQPVRFEFDRDRVLVSVRIRKLATRKRTWHNFTVRARYRADMGRMHVDLERDGGVELISERLGFRDQIALRGIFTKVMSRHHRLNLLRGEVANNARLRDLVVTQFVAQDGWIGISIGRHPDGASASSAADKSPGPQGG